MNRRGFIKALLGTAAAVAVLPQLDLLPEAELPAWTAGAATFTKGDIFTISGVYARHPITQRVIHGRLQQFVITADVVSSTVTFKEAEPQIYPRLIADGPYANVSNLPSADAELMPLYTGKTVPCTVTFADA